MHVSDVVLESQQALPPCFGGGLSHFLDLLLVPEPHDLEQLLQEPHCPQLPLTGPEKLYNAVKSVSQSLQCAGSVFGPGHEPLLQDLVLVFVPNEHKLQEPQVPQEPVTELTSTICNTYEPEQRYRYFLIRYSVLTEHCKEDVRSCM